MTQAHIHFGARAQSGGVRRIPVLQPGQRPGRCAGLPARPGDDHGHDRVRGRDRACRAGDRRGRVRRARRRRSRPARPPPTSTPRSTRRARSAPRSSTSAQLERRPPPPGWRGRASWPTAARLRPAGRPRRRAATATRRCRPSGQRSGDFHPDCSKRPTNSSEQSRNSGPIRTPRTRANPRRRSSRSARPRPGSTRRR